MPSVRSVLEERVVEMAGGGGGGGLDRLQEARNGSLVWIFLLRMNYSALFQTGE